MAESVDASVSNTDGEIRAGSTPAPGTELEILPARVSNFFFTLTQLIGLLIDKVEHFIQRIGSMLV